MIRQILLSVRMVSFDPDPMSCSPEVVENSFLFLCFTLLWVPRHSSVNFDIFTVPFIIKYFYLTCFCNSFLQVGNGFLTIECLVLSVLSTLGSLVNLFISSSQQPLVIGVNYSHSLRKRETERG